MSRGYNKNGLYIDIGLLRDHISKLREEKKLVSGLYENIAVMKTAADPMVADQYDLVLRDIEQVIEYFNTMANQLAHIDDEAVQLSHELRSMIEDSTDLSQRITAENFVL